MSNFRTKAEIEAISCFFMSTDSNSQLIKESDLQNGAWAIPQTRHRPGKERGREGRQEGPGLHVDRRRRYRRRRWCGARLEIAIIGTVDIHQN